MLEDRRAGPTRVISLGDLRKLLRVSEQDKIRGRESDGGSIRERELPSLVDETTSNFSSVLAANTTRPHM